MKVAIVGGGPLGIEMALDLLSLGARVSLFASVLGGNIKEMNDGGPKNLSMGSTWRKLVGHHGQEVLGQLQNNPLEKIDLDSFPTVTEFWETYLKPITESDPIRAIFKEGEVKRVHKRFLGLSEEVPEKSRLHDLFRVVYLVSPDESSFSEQRLENLSEDVLKSLRVPIEKFDDFDIVVDATGVLGNPCPMGPSSSLALNESSESIKEKVFYGVDIFSHLSNIVENSKRIVVVGSGETASQVLLELRGLIENKECEVVVVTTEEKPFKNVLNSNSFLKEDLKGFLDERNYDFQKGKEKFEKEVMEWKELEDYVKAKVPRPPEPVRNPMYWHAANVVSVDKLIDREDLYLTCEDIDFRGGGNKIKTFSCDSILVACGYESSHGLYSGLRTGFDITRKRALSDDGSHEEPGFFTLGPVKGREMERYTLWEGLEQIKMVRKRILSFFTKVGA